MTNVERARLRVDRAAKRYARWANARPTKASRAAFAKAVVAVTDAGKDFAWSLAHAVQVEQARKIRRKRTH